MGIPALLKQICKRYPMVKTNLDKRPNYSCNNLFIDATCFLIEAVNINPENEKCKTMLSADMLDDCFFLFNSLVHLLQPTDLIFISVDGPPPNAKTWQSRQRRYGRKSSKLGCYKPISPICLAYERNLTSFLEEKAKTDEFWRRPNIIYSGSKEPGEGEHKFINYIRSERSKPSWKPNQKHCIFTPDNDLILLALQTHEPFITVCYQNYKWKRFPDNENIHRKALCVTPEAFNLIDINLLREFLMFDMKSHDERIIDEFIAIALVLGTDFYPHPDLEMITIDTLIKCYHSRQSKDYISVDGSYNMQVFKDFLITMLNKVAESRNISYDKYCEEEMEKFVKRGLSEQQEKELSHSVLDAFNWTLNYFVGGVPSWGWAYKTYFAPPLCLVAKNIDDYEPNFRKNDKPPTLLYSVFTSSSPKRALMPDDLFDVRKNDPYMQEILLPKDKIEKDEFSTDENPVLKVATIDYERTMNILKTHTKKLPDKLKWVNRIFNAYEIKTGKKVPCTYSPAPFKPVNLSNKIPEGISNINSLRYVIQETEDHVSIVPEICEVSSFELLSYFGKVFYVNWPYNVPAVVVGSSINPEENAVAGFNLPKFAAIVSVQLLDNTLSHTIGDPFNYPAGLLIPMKEEVTIKKGETVSDEFAKEVYDDESEWISINEIANDKEIDAKHLINAISGVRMNDTSYSLQLLGQNYVIPGFTKLDKSKSDEPSQVYVSKDIVPKIVNYVQTIPPEFLEEPTISSPDDSVIDAAVPLILELQYKTPWNGSQNAQSLNWKTFQEIEQQRGTLLEKKKNVTYKGFTKDYKLGQHVMIITDKTVAPKGTIGTVVVNDPINKELWLVCHNFDDGIKYINTLNSRSGLIVSYTHVIPL